MLLAGAGRAQEPAPPPIVIDGLRVLVSTGIDSAISVWLRGSPLEDDTASAGQIRRIFAKLPPWAGKPVGFDILKTYALGTHLKRTYAVLLLDGGPMFLRFDYYLSPKGWILQHGDFNTDPEKVLPSAIRQP
jgi:hypothetical protein